MMTTNFKKYVRPCLRFSRNLGRNRAIPFVSASIVETWLDEGWSTYTPPTWVGTVAWNPQREGTS